MPIWIVMGILASIAGTFGLALALQRFDLER
jgi:hypothetical protein